MSYEEHALESKQIDDKLFGCLEAPIQEWLADYLKCSPSEAFEDYNDDVDVIGFQENKLHYNTYAVTLSYNEPKHVDEELLKSSEKARKTCSMLFDGVYKVFPAVLQSVNAKYKEKIAAMRPIFDESTMSFKLVRINSNCERLQLGLEQIKKIDAVLADPNQKIKDEDREQLICNLESLKQIVKEFNKQLLDDEEKVCVEENDNLKHFDKLYMVIEQVDPNDMSNLEESMKRLPVFGIPFEDPDDGDFIEQLRDE